MTTCPVCKKKQAETVDAGQSLQFRFDCSVCGSFHATHQVRLVLEKVTDDTLFGLSSYIRQSNVAGQVPLLKSEDWQRLNEAHSHAPVGRKLRAVLEHVARTGKRLGSTVYISQSSDYPKFMAAEAEVPFLVETAITQGLMQRSPNGGLTLTATGWEMLEPIGGGGIPGACFVAMSFDESVKKAYDDGIAEAVIACGFHVIRLDRVEHSENINDRMLGDIRRSQFVIADFTHHPAGVYFEAGFALGLGKLVIWTCKKSDFHEKVHFDTRPYNHILWESETELRDKLTNRMRALIPNAKA